MSTPRVRRTNTDIHFDEYKKYTADCAQSESNAAWLIIQPPSFSESIARYGLYWLYVVALTVIYLFCSMFLRLYNLSAVYFIPVL